MQAILQGAQGVGEVLGFDLKFPAPVLVGRIIAAVYVLESEVGPPVMPYQTDQVLTARKQCRGQPQVPGLEGVTRVSISHPHHHPSHDRDVC